MLSTFWQSENKNAKEIKPRFGSITLSCGEAIISYAKASYLSSEKFLANFSATTTDSLL